MTTSTPLTRLTVALLGAGSLFVAAAVDAGTPRAVGGAIQLLRPEGAVTAGEGLLSEAAPSVVASWWVGTNGTILVIDCWRGRFRTKGP